MGKRKTEAHGISKERQARVLSNRQKRKARALKKEQERQAQTSGRVYQIKVTLTGSEPPIWRRVEVPGEYTLLQLHRIMQTVMEWDGSHLHEFKIGRMTFGNPEFDGGLFGPRVLDEEDVKLNELGLRARSEFSYVYDFGDNWHHTLLLEKALDADPNTEYPVCTGGEMAAPPDDCGGLGGYYNLQEILEDPADPEYEERKEWFGGGLDATAFDLEMINRRLG